MYQIIYEPNEVYEFAAEELARYYAKITGQIVHRYQKKQQDCTPIWLGSPEFIQQQAGITVPTNQLRYDGYWIQNDQNNLAISGLEPRSVLYGVYRLLEEVGCRWMFPGELGEKIPTNPSLQFPPCQIIDNPDFADRTTTDDTQMEQIVDSYVQETLEKFDWAAKNRLNAYYLNPNICTGDIYLKPFILREITKRGFNLEVGGHNTALLIDRSLFATKPELFREVNGKRRSDGNMCASNPEGIQIIIDGIGRLIEKLPNVSCFHLWFEDSFGGSWCNCPKCRNLTPPQQILKVLKPVAEAYPEQCFDFILYHDSEDVSSITEQLPDNMVAYFAPRERCYIHRLSHADCKRNQIYYKQVQEAGNKFSAIYPFEYYTDMILFNKMGVNLQRTLHEDLLDYKNLGVNQMTLLMFNRYSWFAYKLNMVTFARHTWSMDCDYMAVRKELCDTYFGNQADAMMDYYALQQQFTDLMLQFCGYDDVHDIRNIIPLNREFADKHLSDLAKAEAILVKMDALLSQAEKATDDVKIRYLLNSEKICVDITKQTASITRRFMKARQDKTFYRLPEEQFDSIMDELIAQQKQLAAFGDSLPYSLVGINGKTIFQTHLCGDLSTFYRSLKSTEQAKEFKTF